MLQEEERKNQADDTRRNREGMIMNVEGMR